MRRRKEKIFDFKLLCTLVLSTVLIAVYTNVVFGQKGASRYQGNYRILDNLMGRADYQYDLINGDTIKNGDFRFQRFTEQYAESDSITGTVLNGVFQNNIKNGPWRYVSRAFTISGNPQALDARVVYNVSGKEFLINANFKDGTAHGNYEIVDRLLENSLASDTLYYANFNFKKGTVSGLLQGFTNELVAIGNFDHEGFPDGDWIFAHQLGTGQNIREIRQFDHGLFKKHYYEIGDEIYEIKHVGFDTTARSGLGLLARIPVTKSYFRALDYTKIILDTTAINTHDQPVDIGSLISKANTYMERIMSNPAYSMEHNVWQKLRGSEKIGPMMIKVSKKPYSETELAYNVSSLKLLEESKSLTSAFLTDPSVQIGRFANEQLARTCAAVEIYKNTLDTLSPIIHFMADSASVYVDHQAIMNFNSIHINYPSQLSFEINNHVKNVDFQFIPPLTEFNIQSLNTHLTSLQKEVSSLVEKTATEISNIKAQGELSQNESEVISLRDSIIHLFSHVDSTSANMSTLRQKIKASVVSQMNASFKQYSSLPITERLLAVEQLINCYNSYITFHSSLITYEAKLTQIEEEYTRSVWNAYTYTYMEERVKERLYVAYEEYMLPYIIKAMKTGLDCDNISFYEQQLAALLDKMIQLRQEDTKAIEQQIRRGAKDAAHYFNILGISTHKTTQ